MRVGLWRWRRAWCAAACGIAVAVVVGELRPPPAPSTSMVVVAHALPAGAVLTAADLRLIRVDPGAVPDGAPARVDGLTGHTLVVAVPSGLAIVPSLINPAGLAATAPPGTVVAPVRLADPAVAAMLRPGDLVDVLAAGGSGSGEPTSARVLAHRARVLAAGAPSGEESAGGGLLDLGGAAQASPVTVLAVLPGEATALAGALGWGSLTAVLVR